MQTQLHEFEDTSLQTAGTLGGIERGFSLLKLVLLNGAILLSLTASSQAGTFLAFSTAAGGAAIAQQSANAYQTSLGNLNALGIGPASQAGVSIATQATGALYYTQLTATVGCIFGNCYVNGYVSTNFAHPAALVVYGCPSSSSCSSSANYSALSTNSGAPTQLVAAPGVANNTTVTIGLAFFVPDNNGASAFAGADTATVTFTVIDNVFGGIPIENDTLSFNAPNENVQTAVRLNLASDPAGLTVSPATDFSMNFGNVNALGIGPAPGLTTVGAGGGIVYSTPYQIQPAFTGFASTSATVNVYVSMDFTHFNVLQLDDSAAAGGPYNAISKNAGTQTQISNAFVNRSTNSRYLGLFVSELNGAASFTGTDNAILTYTITVP